MKAMIGIVGGMGSHAAVSFFQQLIDRSPARTDQDYMEILLHNNARIPDRTENILYGGEDPLPELVRSVRILENGGATIIVLACVTAHHYYNRLEEALTQAKLFHIVRETADSACRMYPNLKQVGILATEGTIQTRLWQEELHRRQIEALVLADADQEDYFNKVVYGPNGIKAGYRDAVLKNKLLAGCQQLIAMGAEAIIGACSELPLVLSKEEVPVPYIDSIQVTVAQLIDVYYNRTHENERTHPSD